MIIIYNNNYNIQVYVRYFVKNIGYVVIYIMYFLFFRIPGGTFERKHIN